MSNDDNSAPHLASTGVGGGGRWFPTTQWSIVLAAGANPEHPCPALEKLCGTYWYPLYSYVRRRGYSPHDAQDITQAFFARLLERNDLISVSPEKGKFRSFLLASMNHFLSHERERVRAAKRGGGVAPISLDVDAAEDHFSAEPASNASPESAFDKQWAVTLLEMAFARVRQDYDKSGKVHIFDKLKPFLGETGETGDYVSAATVLKMTANSVAVSVHRLRQRYRKAVRREIADTVAGADDVDGEMRHLYAALAG